MAEIKPRKINNTKSTLTTSTTVEKPKRGRKSKNITDENIQQDNNIQQDLDTVISDTPKITTDDIPIIVDEPKNIIIDVEKNLDIEPHTLINSNTTNINNSVNGDRIDEERFKMINSKYKELSDDDLASLLFIRFKNTGNPLAKHALVIHRTLNNPINYDKFIKNLKNEDGNYENNNHNNRNYNNNNNYNNDYNDGTGYRKKYNKNVNGYSNGTTNVNTNNHDENNYENKNNYENRNKYYKKINSSFSNNL